MQFQKKGDYIVESKSPRFTLFEQPHKTLFNYLRIKFSKLRIDPTNLATPLKGFLLPQIPIAHVHNVSKKEHPSMKLAHELFSKGKGSFTRINKLLFLVTIFSEPNFRV